MPGDAANWRRFLFQACLNSVIPWTLIAWGERYVDAGADHHPQFGRADLHLPFLTFAITRHEAVTPRKLFGVVAGMAGICLIVGVQAFRDWASNLPRRSRSLLAAICYACAAIFSRGFKGLDPMAPAAGSLIAGAAILIPLSLVVEQPWTLAPSTSSLLALLALRCSRRRPPLRSISA